MTVTALQPPPFCRHIRIVSKRELSSLENVRPDVLRYPRFSWIRRRDIGRQVLNDWLEREVANPEKTDAVWRLAKKLVG
jgi:hypothetical protein